MAASAQSSKRQFLLDYIFFLHRSLFDTDRKLTKMAKDDMTEKKLFYNPYWNEKLFFLIIL